MNLLDEAFVPVRKSDGVRIKVRPADLSDPRIVAFDAERPDFNGALAQLIIGLLQTSSSIDTEVRWRKLLADPPSRETLDEWFKAYRYAFEVDGDGARFMQDFELRAGDGNDKPIARLLIDTPGANTEKTNSDLFIKRGRNKHLCWQCAITALLTLQINGPSGGSGHRTGLRGGGPLTTLLVAEGRAGSQASLWSTLWLNVQLRSKFLGTDGEADEIASHLIFPWLAPQSKTQKDGGQVTPAQVHPAHVYWAMPRRIRLDFDRIGTGACDLCGERSDCLLSSYITRKHGLDYKGAWSHPLSPYYKDKAKEQMLPLHPQPDGLGYRHWMAWILGASSDTRQVQCAPAVDAFFASERRVGVGMRLWAFGFDMSDMSARCWYESMVPLYGLPDCDRAAQKAVRDDVGSWLSGAELAASYLRSAAEDAWFRLEARGDLGSIDAAFWSRTAGSFYDLIRLRIAAVRDGNPFEGIRAAESWRSTLSTTILKLFDDELVGAGPVERMNPGRISNARRQLDNKLQGPKLRSALGLPTPRTASKTTGPTQPPA